MSKRQKLTNKQLSASGTHREDHNLKNPLDKQIQAEREKQHKK